MSRAGLRASSRLALLLLVSSCGGAEQSTSHPAPRDAGSPDSREEIPVPVVEFAIDHGPAGDDEGEATPEQARPAPPPDSPCLAVWEPEDVPTSLERARDLYVYGAYREAIVCFSRIVELDPALDDQLLTVAYQYLGASYFLLGREAEARDASRASNPFSRSAKPGGDSIPLEIHESEPPNP